MYRYETPSILICFFTITLALCESVQISQYSVQFQLVSGDKQVGISAVYGDKGVPSTRFSPGNRQHHDMCINPLNGKILMFGGSVYAYGNRNDLWEYFENRWAWLSGSNLENRPSVYGSLNVPAVEHVPGARHGHTIATDFKNTLAWLFGGIFYNSEFLNDLWQWDPRSNTWTWRSGNNKTNHRGIYGAKNEASTTNFPGARYCHAMIFHPSGILVVFGGSGYDQDFQLGPLNDLWYFDTADSTWTWASGSSKVNDSGLDEAKQLMNPRARCFHSMSYSLSEDLLYVHGGYTGARMLNDFWRWSFQMKQWSFISGNQTNARGIRGKLGEAAVENYPGIRASHSIVVDDNSGVVLLFGGESEDEDGINKMLNDLWLYDPVDNMWTWIAGSHDSNQAPNFSKESTSIGGVSGFSMVFQGDQRALYVFGGTGTMGDGSGPLNLLWKASINVDCPFGYFLNGLRCEICPTGTFFENKVCVPCPVGTFADQTLMTECKPCPNKYYQPHVGKSDCLICPDHSECSSTDFLCSAGFSPSRTHAECVACPKNFWKPVSGNHDCFPCPASAKYCAGTSCISPNNRPCPDNTETSWLQSASFLSFIAAVMFFNFFIIGFMIGFFSRFGRGSTTDTNHTTYSDTTTTTSMGQQSMTSDYPKVTPDSEDMTLMEITEV